MNSSVKALHAGRGTCLGAGVGGMCVCLGVAPTNVQGPTGVCVVHSGIQGGKEPPW